MARQHQPLHLQTLMRSGGGGTGRRCEGTDGSSVVSADQHWALVSGAVWRDHA